MTDCCDYGKCTNGPDCPVRKQRAKEVNEAFIRLHQGIDDPYDDFAAVIKGVIALVFLAIGLVMVVFAIWGK